MGSRGVPVTETRYTKPWETVAMASMRSSGVVGVVRSTSSRPAAVATSLTGPVSSKGMSGTSNPAEPRL